jgi:hypothetical protein
VAVTRRPNFTKIAVLGGSVTKKTKFEGHGSGLKILAPRVGASCTGTWGKSK